MSEFERTEWKRLNRERYNQEAEMLQAGEEIHWRTDERSFRFLVNPWRDRFYEENSTKGYDQRALEVGCGVGAKTPYLVQGEARLVGLEIAPTMARLASNRNPGPLRAFLAGDAERLPFASGSFDSVYLLDVLHHLPLMQRGIEEAGRVCRAGGKVVILDPNGKSLIAKMVRKLTARYRHPLYAEEPVDPDDILESLQQNGFTRITQQLMCSIGYAYPHVVYRVPVPFKWLLYLFLPVIYLIDAAVLGRWRYTAWLCGIVAAKS